jgi:23S rRNA pseudouridine1911/1915/1917 synthase
MKEDEIDPNEDGIDLLEGEGDEELFEHFKIVCDAGQSPIRLDKFLTMHIVHATRTKIQNAISLGSALVNGKPNKASYPIRPHDVLTIVLPKPPTDHTITPQDIPLDIVYEDKDVMVINKAASMVVHPGVGNPDGTLINALAYYLRYKSPTPPTEEEVMTSPGLVHRIDKDTSGLILIAKTTYAMQFLAQQFAAHTVHRRYVALVWKNFDEEEGTINKNVGRDPRERMRMTTFNDPEEGKWAVTHYKVLERFYYTTLVECRLETGRTHQIRIHMKSIGHTLFNDYKYGGNEILAGTIYTKYKAFVQNAFKLLPRQALHAKEIGFRHPSTNEMMYFDSELPSDMIQCIEKWRHYFANRKELVEMHSEIAMEDEDNLLAGLKLNK